MTHDPNGVDPREAGDLLKSVEGVERRTQELLNYGRAGDYMILWGVIWLLGYGVADRLWPYTATIWYGLDLIGLIGTGWITWRAATCGGSRPAGRPFVYLRPMICVAVLIGFGMFWVKLAHIGGREQNIFWPTICGAILFCVGLWAGRVLAIGAALVVALVVGGYYWAGDWFSLWIAVVVGGALILGGLWLRR
jgi:hypothetical protein